MVDNRSRSAEIPIGTSFEPSFDRSTDVRWLVARFHQRLLLRFGILVDWRKVKRSRQASVTGHASSVPFTARYEDCGTESADDVHEMVLIVANNPVKELDDHENGSSSNSLNHNQQLHLRIQTTMCIIIPRSSKRKTTFPASFKDITAQTSIQFLNIPKTTSSPSPIQTLLPPPKPPVHPP